MNLFSGPTTRQSLASIEDELKRLRMEVGVLRAELIAANRRLARIDQTIMEGKARTLLADRMPDADLTPGQ